MVAAAFTQRPGHWMADLQETDFMCRPNAPMLWTTMDNVEVLELPVIQQLVSALTHSTLALAALKVTPAGISFLIWHNLSSYQLCLTLSYLWMMLLTVLHLGRRLSMPSWHFLLANQDVAHLTCFLCSRGSEEYWQCIPEPSLAVHNVGNVLGPYDQCGEDLMTKIVIIMSSSKFLSQSCQETPLIWKV